MPTPSRNFPPGEQVHLGRLLNGQHGLPLRQDDDPGDQLHGGHRGQIAVQDHRLVKRGVHVIGALPAGMHRGVRARHVVVGQHVGEPEFPG